MGKKRRKPNPRDRHRSKVTDPLEAAIRLHQADRLAEAEQAYLRVQKSEPGQVQPIYLLGVVARQLGRSNDAIERFRRAVSIQPDHVEAINELAQLLNETGQFEESAEALRRLVALRPNLGELYNNLGVVLRRLRKTEEARGAYARAVELAPDRAEAHYNLGTVLSELDRHHEAADAFRQAIALKPEFTDAHRALASVLRDSGRLEEARGALTDWLRHDPDHPVARHMASAFGGKDTPTRASDGYVRSVFGKFATTYDDDLRELSYQGPRLIAEAVTEQLGGRKHDLVVLDAGCGTGLCGHSLRSISRRLMGVDLSAEMIQQARELRLYDELIVAELTEFLVNHPDSFDLIVAGDTFNYFGELVPLLTATAGALRAKGLLIYTLEECDISASVTGYCLNPHGRYSHSEDYVKRCAMQCHLTTHSIESATLRTERGQPVTGLVVRSQRQ